MSMWVALRIKFNLLSANFRKYTQIDFRAQHGGLVWDYVRAGIAGRTQDLRKRDQWQATLWDGLSASQQDAMVCIEKGYRISTNGIGMKTFDPCKISGISTANNSDRLYIDFRRWCAEVKKRGHNANMALSVIVDGKSFTEVDREYKRRRHTTRANLHECLNIYCKQHGWPI